MRLGDLAVGRAGDKGRVLDLTLVAKNRESYERLEHVATAEAVQAALAYADLGSVQRYAVPGLLALKFVLPDALPGGVYATLHAGLHWQKAAIWMLLDLEIDGDSLVAPPV
jgi:hypothetical protein